MVVAVTWIVLLLSLLAWLGQTLSAAAPALAVRWGLAEAETEVDPTFHADGRGEAAWDAVSLWPLPLAAGLLLLDHSSWPLWALLGSGTYIYFGGRGIAQRLVMRRRGIRVGKESTVKTAYLFLALWGLSGLFMAGLAARQILSGG